MRSSFRVWVEKKTRVAFARTPEVYLGTCAAPRGYAEATAFRPLHTVKMIPTAQI